MRIQAERALAALTVVALTLLTVFSILGLAMLAGSRADDRRGVEEAAAAPSSPVVPAETPRSGPAERGGLFGLFHRVSIPAGTAIRVRLETGLSTETASRGDRWEGITTFPVVVNDRIVVPEGSRVRGDVVLARPAHRGVRASIQLALRNVVVRGREQRLLAYGRPVTAGSTRTRNLGGIAAGTAAGALLGKAVADRPLAGALVGAGASGAIVYASKGYQVRLPAGTLMRFTTADEVALR